MKKLEKLLEWGGMKRDIVFLILSGIALIFSLFDLVPLPFDAAWVAILLCGLPIVLEAFIGLVTAFDIKADVLVSLALIASVCIGEDFAAGEVAFIMQLGALLEDATVAKARSGIEKLVHLTPQTARRISVQGETIIPAQEVQVGDRLRVLAGETIPVDGEILSGQTSVDQSVMTGESMPVDKGPGDAVKSGTVNQFGVFEMTATHVGEDSSLQRLIRLVQSADADKAKIVSLADRWATWIVVIALTAAALTGLITGEIIRAVTILVVFCPCALVLATPTAIMAAIGNAARHGALVREGGALERLAGARKITFDKTGTLTYGKPEVVAVKSCLPEWSEEALFRMTAGAEQMSEHPLGKALVEGYRKRFGSEPEKPEQFQMIPGRGIAAVTGSHRLLAGNEELLRENGITVSTQLAETFLTDGCTVVYIAVDEQFAGLAALSDALRPQASETIARLKELRAEPVLLTGDRAQVANHIAKAAGIADVVADCLPEDKLKAIGDFQLKGLPVCMVGDGINDAPALKKADVGIAMGGIGSDIAVEAADIALTGDDISCVAGLIALAKRMMVTIKLNMTFSMALNFVAILLAMTGILNPVIGALVHNAGSVLVILNSALLLRWKMKEKTATHPKASVRQSVS